MTAVKLRVYAKQPTESWTAAFWTDSQCLFGTTRNSFSCAAAKQWIFTCLPSLAHSFVHWFIHSFIHSLVIGTDLWHHLLVVLNGTGQVQLNSPRDLWSFLELIWSELIDWSNFDWDSLWRTKPLWPWYHLRILPDMGAAKAKQHHHPQ